MNSNDAVWAIIHGTNEPQSATSQSSAKSWKESGKKVPVYEDDELSDAEIQKRRSAARALRKRQLKSGAFNFAQQRNWMALMERNFTNPWRSQKPHMMAFYAHDHRLQQLQRSAASSASSSPATQPTPQQQQQQQ